MTTSSPKTSKEKGRRFQQECAALIRRALNLPEADVVSRPMGSPGADIILSTAALKLFPFAVECKRTETWELREWWRQAQTNATETIHPLLVFRRNRGMTYAILRTRDYSIMTRKWVATYPGHQGGIIKGPVGHWLIEKWMDEANFISRKFGHRVPGVTIINEPLDDNICVLSFNDLLLIMRQLAELAGRLPVERTCSTCGHFWQPESTEEKPNFFGFGSCRKPGQQLTEEAQAAAGYPCWEPKP